MGKMDNIKITKIKAIAKLGSSVNDCIRDCMELCIKERRNVELTHNGLTYDISFNEMFSTVDATKR